MKSISETTMREAIMMAQDACPRNKVVIFADEEGGWFATWTSGTVGYIDNEGVRIRPDITLKNPALPENWTSDDLEELEKAVAAFLE